MSVKEITPPQHTKCGRVWPLECVLTFDSKCSGRLTYSPPHPHPHIYTQSSECPSTKDANDRQEGSISVLRSAHLILSKTRNTIQSHSLSQSQISSQTERQRFQNFKRNIVLPKMNIYPLPPLSAPALHGFIFSAE